MKTKTKVITGIIALILSAVLAFTIVAVSYNTSKSQVAANDRTIELSQSAVDVQSVFDEFEGASLTREGDTVYFEGFKTIDKNKLGNIDYISDVELEELENCVTKYNFSYNSKTNIVTLAATATLSDGTVEIDEITGVGFVNDKNEIDAVMNVDGEGILLSEMREAGLIQNCGWFSNLIKKVAIAVAVVAVAVAAVALVVATAGAAAPAVVAAGIGVSTTVVTSAAATAATIGAYATITAAIAAGVYVAANEIDNIHYNGVNYKAEELTEAKIKKLPVNTYYVALAASDGKLVFCATPILRCLAVAIMRANTNVSVYTFNNSSARGITQEASDFMSPIFDYRHNSGYFNHYHLGNLTGRGENHSICKSHAFFGFPVA